MVQTESVNRFPQDGHVTGSAADVQPNVGVLIGGSLAVALVSAALLAGPAVVASLALGALMLAGADVDARTRLLPDSVTLGALACGIIAAPVLDPAYPVATIAGAVARAAAVAAALALMRIAYAKLRHREGLGSGDVKLAGAVGAWLSIEAVPLCFGLATTSALIAITFARLRGQGFDRTMRIPFGAFLCPALWLVFFVSMVPR
jgi:leader peptidase (prepilin peptidase) / N-methyltransferase